MALPKKNWLNNVIDTWKDLLWMDKTTNPVVTKKPLLPQGSNPIPNATSNEWISKNFLTYPVKAPNTTNIKPTKPTNTGFVNNGLPSINNKVWEAINKLPTAITPISWVKPVVPPMWTPLPTTAPLPNYKTTAPLLNWTNSTDNWLWTYNPETVINNNENYKSDIKDLEKIQKENLDKTKQDFILWKADLEKNKSYITNYNDISTKYNGVMNDITANLDVNWQVPEEKYQEIANKYWLTLDEVKNPKTITDKAIYSEVWKKELWITWREDELSNLTTELDRNKADYQTQLDDYLIKVNQSIDDTNRQMNIDLGWMDASGAWTWAWKSSGYAQWMQNVKDDANRTIWRLKAEAERMSGKTWLELKRLQEDYDKNFKSAKLTLDNEIKDLKHNWMANLIKTSNELTWEKLTNALKDIKDKFWSDSIDVYLKYQTALKWMNDNTKSQMDNIAQYHTLEDYKSNQRFWELTANNGLLLKNTSVLNIIDEYKKGNLTSQKAKDIINIINTQIQKELWKNWAVLDDKDLTTINNLLKAWNTPTKVLAEMQKLPKFTPKTPVDIDIKEIGWNIYKIDKKSWAYEVIQKAPVDNKPIEVWGYIYQKDETWSYQNVWTWYQKPTAEEKWFTLNEWQTRYDASWNVIAWSWWSTWVWQYTIANKGFKEWTWTSVLNGIDPTWTLYKRMLALWMQEWWLTFEKDWWMRTNQALVVDKATWKLIRNENTWLDIWTFQIHWWTQKEAWDKFNNNLVKWWQLAQQMWINVDIENLSNQDKQIIAHLWYINARFPWALEWLANPNIQGKDLWNLIEKIQWSVKGSWNNFLKQLNNIQESWWQWASEWDINKFKYADDMTDAWRQKYLKENKLEDKYINYKASKKPLSPEEGTQLSKILKWMSWTAVNEKERDRWEEDYKGYKLQAEKLWKKWADVLRYIDDKIKWYVYYKKEDAPILDKLRKYSFIEWTDLANIVAEKIRNWSVNWAIENIETENFKKAWINVKDITWINANLQNIWWIINKLETKQTEFENKIWPVGGRIAEFNSFLNWDPEYQKLLSDLTYSIAKTRNNIWGTSITANELWFLKNITPDNKDQYKNIVAKLQSWADNWFREINSLRRQAWLPELTKPSQSYNQEYKKKLYLWDKIQTTWWQSKVTPPKTDKKVNPKAEDYLKWLWIK